MLPFVKTYTEKETVDLFGDTGIQFLDLAVKLDLKKEPDGQFTNKTPHGMLARLFTDKNDQQIYEDAPKSFVVAYPAAGLDDVGMAESLSLLDAAWLPVPFFPYPFVSRQVQGPNNWVRLRIVKLAEPDSFGNTHRLTFAFDTRIEPKRDGVAYLAPTDEDMGSGQEFRLAVHLTEMQWFLDQRWVLGWLEEIFRERSAKREQAEVESEVRVKRHVAHYLNLLSLLRGPAPTLHPEIGPRVVVPGVRIKPRNAIGSGKPIPVDLVLDVGNSRTCGVLVEDPEQNDKGLHGNAHLMLRDLSSPELVYDHPFESRVEFARTNLGKEDWSMDSGRHDAFNWVTMARVGAEAARLAALRKGTEGATGLSSPKRYLWDDKPFGQMWYLNAVSVKEQGSLQATLRPLMDFINEKGRALYLCPDDDAVFEAKYSRSSLMTFMLNEIFAQAIVQINSILYRQDKENAATSRWLRTIILTVPPSTPQAERAIFKDRVQQALGLLWKSLGWHEGGYDENPFRTPGAGTDQPWRALPRVLVKWDEATCGQVVYLYTEAGENFGGHPEEFFDVLARPGKPDRESITVASLDIGGGTTDLVVNTYTLRRDATAGRGGSLPIVPQQKFRDGFKVAGDDIVLHIIRTRVLPALSQALEGVGVEHPDEVLNVICGAQGQGAELVVLRQQLTLQLFYPLALKLLAQYEQYDIEQRDCLKAQTMAQWLGSGFYVSPGVRDFVSKAISRVVGRPVDLDLGQIPLTSDPAGLHEDFLKSDLDICKTLAALCEVVEYYACDVLLLTGRPSRLPGVQALIRSLLPLPPGRIVPMHGYRTGTWYPFHKAGRIADAKTTATVGAMICWLSDSRRIPNFYFDPARIRPLPLIRYFGVIDFHNTIAHDNVLFSGVATQTPEGAEPEEGCIVLPKAPGSDRVPPYVLHGEARLGYRQLAAQRWPGAPMYEINFTEKGLKQYKAMQQGFNAAYPEVRVFFSVKKRGAEDIADGVLSDQLEIEDLDGLDSATSAKSHVRFEMNTLVRSSLAQNSYWLDSGSVKL
ncbi:virulence factor [Bordetella ansorpii]|uniref:Virulence factor n=1 Tax=Bordetella ansorpii TaxID=288768 RepID=A0A157Q034_9BORD|nr:virulence factor SrfB [Bordetella ansorpii]SAI39151.1 virulence factor [Bordetella ansorpii]